MSYFSDLYKNRNRLMKQDFDVAHKPLGLKFIGTKKWPSGSSKELWLEVDWTEKDKEVTGSKHKITWKQNSEEFTSKLEIDQNNGKFESIIMPHEWSSDSTQVGLRFFGTSNHAAKDFSWQSMVRLGLPNLADNVALYSSFGVKCGTDAKCLAELTTLAHIARNHKLGFHVEGCIKAKKMTSLEAKFQTHLHDDVTFFTHYFHTCKKLELGFMTRNDMAPWMDWATWKAHLEFDDNKKIKDKSFEMVGQMKYNDNNTFKIKNTFNKGTWLCTGVLAHKVNDGLTIRAADTIAPLDAWKNRNVDTYSFGVNFDFHF